MCSKIAILDTEIAHVNVSSIMTRDKYRRILMESFKIVTIGVNIADQLCSNNFVQSFARFKESNTRRFIWLVDRIGIIFATHGLLGNPGMCK